MKVRGWCFFLFYVVLCNVPLWFASRWLGLTIRGVFGLEFLLVGALSLFAGWRWLNWFIPLLVVCDLFSWIRQTYMLPLRDLMKTASSLPFYIESHGTSLAIIAGMVVAVSVGAALLAQPMEGLPRKPIGWGLITFASLSFLMDSSRGRIEMLHRESIKKDSMSSNQGIRFTRNFLHPLLRGMVDEHVLEVFEKTYTGEGQIKGASTLLMGVSFKERPFSTASDKPNLVFVLVESWGKPLDPSLEDALVTPYQREELQRNYTVSSGTVPFHGPTVAGELREMCGTRMGFGVIDAPASELENCLPRKFDEMGYHTTALHGFLAPMFSRVLWYPNIGFEEMHFLGDFQREKVQQCPGPFPGACDADIAQWIGHKLQTAGGMPQFIYWLTLNSHLPVPIPNRVKDPPACSGNIAMNDSAMCSWYQLIFNVHRSVAKLAMQTMAQPTVFVIVGDHAPPFSRDELRSQFSDTVVPYIVLWPKGETNRNKELRASRSAEALRPFDRLRKASPKKGISRSSFGGE